MNHLEIIDPNLNRESNSVNNQIGERKTDLGDSTNEELALNRKAKLKSKNQLDEMFHRGPTRRSGFKLAAWALASFVVDALIIFASMLLFVVISAVMTKYVLPKNMMNLINQTNLIQTMLLASLAMGWIYYLVMRMFFGATVGEMSCALRIGQPYERLQSFYMVRVLVRLCSISFTGFITLPLLSLIFRKDLAGKISKISLYSLK